MRRGLALGAVLVALALGGCGRRGKLEPPPDPNNPFALGVDEKAADANAPDANAPDADKSRAGVHRRKKNPPIKAPTDPFILDPLL